MKHKIAYQGEPGANSHIACVEAHPDYEPLPCRTFEDAFQAVKSGKADLAMIAIENTTAGRVADVHHLLPDSGLSNGRLTVLYTVTASNLVCLRGTGEDFREKR